MEFPMAELQQQVTTLGHMNLDVKRMPIQKLQVLKKGLLQKNKKRGEEEQ